MSVAAHKRMSADEFLAWSLDREGKWELVEGVPVLAMAGATAAHDHVVVNLIALLAGRLRGGPCWPKTADQAARIPKGNIRRPDVTVDYGARNPKSLESETPAVFFEVLSPSTRGLDMLRKPEEYKTVPTLKHFVMLDPDAPQALVWTRVGETWVSADLEGLDQQIELPGIGVTLTLGEVYEGVEFPSDAERAS
jgi:Uma2 family endonuclease